MDLAWLASVIQPRDVALHPDFDRDERNDIAPAFLAATVLGDFWRLRRLVDVNDLSRGVQPLDTAIVHVSDTFKVETREQGLTALVEILLSREPEDLARSCALTLLASTAAGALDDYETCINLLDDQLRRTATTDLPDERLVQAALLQQKSLRLRDSGEPHQEIAAEVLRVLEDFDVTQCSTFALSRSVSWSAVETLKQIVLTLQDAAYSLISDPHDLLFDSEPSPMRERLRGREVDYLLDLEQMESRQYTDFVQRLFWQQFQRVPPTTIVGSQEPDLFYATLAVELAGHGRVYRTRREQAELWCAEAVRSHNYTYFEDNLRLFRQAASKRNIDLLLYWLRASGPLEALVADARRIISFRLRPRLLRSVELRVLAAAAEILTQGEADVALNAVLESIHLGGPPDLPGEREVQVLRLQSAWNAAAALANTSGRMDEIARQLLTEASEVSGDQLRDRSVAIATSSIEWDSVSSDVKQEWREFLSTSGDEAPIVLSTMAPFLGRSVMMAREHPPDLETIATWLNVSLHGDVIDPQILDAAIPQVRNALSEVRRSAHEHTFSFGGAPAGDIAAALIVHAGVVGLWPDLVHFLDDSAVSRLDRSPAFERLARYAGDVPREVRTELELSAESVLESPDPGLGEGLQPYPEAVRFFGRIGVVEDIRLLDLTARLAGQGAQGRREAAKTLMSWSRNHSSAWVLGFATQLSSDRDAETRAFAARSLTQLAASSSEIASLAEQRLVDLIQADGLLTPLEVLRGLKEFGLALSDDTRAQIEMIRDNHPSRAIRRAARQVLNSDVSEIGEQGQ